MSRENKSKYAILGILTFAPMSGYDIKKKIEVSTSNFWTESYGQIYPILKRLVAEELATQSIEEQTGKPDRNIYTITDKGHEELQRWLTEPVEPQVERIEILLKLFFGNEIAIADSIHHVQQFRKMQEDLLKKYRTIEEDIKNRSENPHSPYWLITASYKLHVTQALIAWCDETLARLDKISKQDDK
jgi:PadR family transcriptional regulator, regulatory protein AphA